ncbi:putative transketolase C-terminal section [Magnetospirillum sp. XM-1]|uniref:transketolase family protein n=1 Tax=Magnetospirillum sp. XM-1 TaxID=1663591 RepID=UPI00073DF956|nr:transketolase C-terminal domain-containing protein [Magnetospirillum sp. XM-1]CUW37997.1 putative transketolase C-terminal section [Magnetospirillum sp. XM-1]
MRKTSLDMVHELARRDARVVFVGSDLGVGTLGAMKKEMPERFFMEGVAEQNIIGMAAGMAMEGFIPYVNTIATFLTRRCFEQVAVDLCLHKLPARLIASGGGMVYAPLGPTHLAVEDMAIMRALPNMTVVAVSDADEMVRLMEQSLDWPDPMYIRLGKGGDQVISRSDDDFRIGKAIVRRSGGEVLLVSTGIATTQALAAAESLAAQGIPCRVLHMHTIKPLDTETLRAQMEGVRLVVTVEEHSVVGGLGSAVLEALADFDMARPPRVRRLGIPDAFVKDYGSQEHLLASFGLDAEGIVRTVKTGLEGL